MPTLNKKLLITLLVSSSFNTLNVQAANVLSCTFENTAITATTTHLTDNNNGTITDPESGLIWKKCSEGQIMGAANNCIGTADIYTWQGALQRAQAVNIGSGENFSQTDWRLPNIKELASIVELRCYQLAINNTVFPATPSSSFSDDFWSSSPDAIFSNKAWYVNFNSGFASANLKSVGGRVRLVRSGQ